LTPELQNEVQELQKRMSTELQPLALEESLTMQKILEAEDHRARCKLLTYFMNLETRRLESKKTLQGLFSTSGSTSADEKDMPAEEMISEDTKLPESSETSSSPSTFFDDEDAFQ
jgi:hypothetical protein